ncbi:MAG TPA: glycosyltransferase family 4 protein [Thermoplasmata archaeon]|nr:glycosyltransferase family 4 protein [Thermoplasmata archaeon]
MRIAQLSTRYPPGPGGVERHVQEVARRLVVRGHAVTAYATDLYREFPWERLPRTVPRTDSDLGVRVRRLPAWSLPGELHYPIVRGLAKALADDRPDIVHAHTYGTHHAAVARRHARRFRVPFVLTAHYHPIWSIHGGWFRHRLRHFYDHRLAGPIVGDASVLVVQSREEERLIRENGFPLPRVAIVPPGYTPLPAPPAGDRPFARSIGVDGPILLFVGRLASNKGLPLLMRAFESLAHHDPTAHLVLVGEDGGERPGLEGAIRARGLGGRVHLPGFVPDERLLAAAFREARLFVLPSEYEAFGLVLLEALAQGTPVVASRVGGIPEFVEDGRAGRLVEPGDPRALEEAILALWDDPDARAAMGTYGRDTIVPRYRWELVVDSLERIYREASAA